MRDIRADLQERLKVAQSQYDAIQSKVGALEEEISLLSRLLNLEDNRAGSKAEASPDMPVAEFFVRAIKERPRSKEELRDLALDKGYFDEIDSPGRGVHLTLVNMMRAGRIREDDDEKFYVIEKESAPGDPAEGRFAPQ